MMRKLLLISLILAGSSALVSAQENRNVVRGEDDKLYVNKNQGVYLWLSTSPDPNAEKIRLNSDSSAHYTNPMYFDTEGYNTVRSPSAVDTHSHEIIYPIRDIIFEVYADGLPPVSKAHFNSSGYKYIEGKKYYGADLEVEISASDAVSGVQSIQYAKNGGAKSTYKELLRDFSPGKNTLVYSAIDKVGNKEEEHEEIFFIDNEPPKTTYRIEGQHNEKYVSASTKIALESSDDLSGVKTIYYSVNGGAYKKYYSPVSASVLTGNTGTLSFYAEDQLGNKEEMQVIGGSETGAGSSAGSASGLAFEFYVDNDPPAVSLSLEGDSFKGKYQYVSPGTKFIIEAQDEKAGVDRSFYSINSNTVDKPYSEPFGLENGGLQYLRVKAVDFVGNTSPVLTNAYYCDNEPPQISYKVGSPKFESRDTLFISDKTEISMSSSDSHSGSAGINYQLDKNEALTYKDKLTIKDQGSHTLKFYAIDNVNNKSEEANLKVFVDNEPPAIHYHFSVESIGSKTVRDEKYTIYPTNVMVYIAATDRRSGNERIEYKINGGSASTLNPVKSLSPGNYLIEVKAYDVLGNVSTEEIKFAIE